MDPVFPQFLHQILVKFQNQGQFWNLHVLSFSKLSLILKFDQDLMEKLRKNRIQLSSLVLTLLYIHKFNFTLSSKKKKLHPYMTLCPPQYLFEPQWCCWNKGNWYQRTSKPYFNQRTTNEDIWEGLRVQKSGGQRPHMASRSHFWTLLDYVAATKDVDISAPQNLISTERLHMRRP